MNPMKIVGVIGDVRQFGPAQTPWAEIYMAYQQHPGPATDMNVVVRTAMEPESLTETLRSKAHELSVDVPVKFTTMEASLSENVAAPRFRTLLLGIFAGLAVCLAIFRRPGGLPGDGRSVWRDVLRRRAALERNRITHGVGSESA